jgi:hypothetical protein
VTAGRDQKRKGLRWLPKLSRSPSWFCRCPSATLMAILFFDFQATACAQAADQSFSLLTWRVPTLRSCVGAPVNGFGGYRESRWRGRCGAWWGSWRMHGRNRADAPAILAHVEMRRLGKLGACLAFRHASWRAISQRRPHDCDSKEGDERYRFVHSRQHDLAASMCD